MIHSKVQMNFHCQSAPYWIWLHQTVYDCTILCTVAPYCLRLHHIVYEICITRHYGANWLSLSICTILCMVCMVAPYCVWSHYLLYCWTTLCIVAPYCLHVCTNRLLTFAVNLHHTVYMYVQIDCLPSLSICTILCTCMDK